MAQSDKSQTIAAACAAIQCDDGDQAAAILRRDYPFAQINALNRKYTDLQMIRIFIRDGFIDRYSGQRLVFAPVLRILSHLFPADFPYHTNWKMSDCHVAYYELAPTLDHILPIARGGSNESGNLVCTSMLRNMAKANWTLEELGWNLLAPGDFQQWDGLVMWYVDYVQAHPTLLGDNYFRRWRTAIMRALNA